MNDLTLWRFEHYFRHPDILHDVLRPGDEVVACGNARIALSWFGIDAGWSMAESARNLFDESLLAAVRGFQIRYHHRVADGLIGPETRRRLTREILHAFPGNTSIFKRLELPEDWRDPSVFLSYAWSDSERVDKVDQWLRDNRIHVIRDRDSSIAGESIEENIARAISSADKIVAILSQNSRDRDWPLPERTLAEQLEGEIGTSVLIYVRLDDTELPVHDSTRLAISAYGVPLKEVGQRILHAVAGTELIAPTHPYDENEPM